jgi:type I restriction enzyme S subunit
MSDDAEQVGLDEVVEEYEEEEEGGEEASKEEKCELFGIGEVPQTWEIEEMDKCVEVIPGNSPPSETYNESGDGLPFFQGNAEFGHFYPVADTWCSEPRKTAKENDILMSIRAPVGDLNIADRECCIGRGLAALRPTELNGLYLYYSLAKRNAWLSRLATGSTFKSVTKSDLKNLDVACPPLSEQRKIASVLYNVDEAIRKTEEIIEQTKRVQHGYIRERVIAENREGERKEGTVGTRRVSIPAEWDTVRLAEVAELVSGKSFPQKYQEGDAGPIPVVKVEDMNLPGNDKYIQDVTNRVTDETIEELNKNIFPSDAIIHPRVGEALLLNKMRITTEKSAFDDNIMGWLPEADKINPEYLYYASTMIDFNAVAQTGTVPSINKEMAGSFRFPQPPMEEQKEIAEDLSKVDVQISVYEEEKNRLHRLKRALMQDLLTGEVRTKDRDIDVLPEVEAHG